MFWNPVISPSGLIFYTGDRFKGWEGECTPRSAERKSALARVVEQSEVAASGPARVLASRSTYGFATCSRGPGGNLYIATELQSKGVNPDGSLMRIVPAPQGLAVHDRSQVGEIRDVVAPHLAEPRHFDLPGNWRQQ